MSATGRVVFVCPNLEAGGAERQWAALVPGLADLGFDVRVITLDGRGPYFEELAAGGSRSPARACATGPIPPGSCVWCGWPGGAPPPSSPAA